MQREEKAIGDARASHRVRLGAMLAVACGMLLCWVLSNTRLTWIAPTARVYARRSGHFTVNVSGALSPLARMARYRLNGGEWSAVGQGAPRVQPPFFMIELDPARLRAGANRVSIETYAYGQWRPRAAEVNVNYDPSAVRLPVEIDWREGQLEIEEGCWEIADIAGERVARPKPGYEEYDRIAIIAGAFEGGRSIRAEMTFRGQICQRPFGFGVLSLWGGRPDHPGVPLRRGWLYGMAWFYSPQNGVGNQFSYKHGGREELTRESFRSYEVRPGIRYVVHVEARPRLDAQGRPAGYHQRMKWWAKGEPIPEEWIELDCGEGDPLRVAEYGVAIIAHRCKVDFGRVTVRALLNSEFRSQNSE